MRPLALVVALLLAVPAVAAPRLLVEMSTQTGMPHLDDNLRYAIVRETRCLDLDDLSSAFWMIRHESLQGCRLDKAGDGGTDYLLVCDGTTGTTGDAKWQFEPQRISGTLHVRLGGKNMTFWQRIEARPVGGCADR